MSCAALANISFMNTDSLIKYDTLTIVLNSIRQRFESSMDQSLLKDQIITLLANMSQKHQLIVVSSGGLIFLIQTLLAIDIDNNDNRTMERSKILSIERIQQKIAVALARLGNHKSTAKIIYKLNGVSKLIQLCKEPKQRNYSDTVLLASIAALKRLAQSIGRLPFKELNALDLIDSKLQDIFIQYSIKNESLVPIQQQNSITIVLLLIGPKLLLLHALVRNVNDGFERLRNHLPLLPNQREKRLSKVETLRLAISYIKHLQNLLES
ncbi:hypothetical protein DERP_009980 [Dermatophagoides pteronyssinus]|uniref:BHLH domain-containing protein n=1 Tax=Dermatophagoides pteronyssinus TaxID=6956 RepID=A0ABQ8J219_DERPT|nr:hypothetical protein DERP_009980 [Dermatophagoides pteronyssinus]